VNRCVEIALTIPDNEAATAAATLRRLGLGGGTLERADAYRLSVADGTSEDELLGALRRIETLFNPNKHVLRARPPEPGPGEVWIHEIAHGPARSEGPVRIAGRTLPGVESIERFIIWRLRDESGAPASRDAVRRATDALLCNPAFQTASLA
jgi:hypothetical protein